MAHSGADLGPRHPRISVLPKPLMSDGRELRLGLERGMSRELHAASVALPSRPEHSLDAKLVSGESETMTEKSARD